MFASPIPSFDPLWYKVETYIARRREGCAATFRQSGSLAMPDADVPLLLVRMLHLLTSQSIGHVTLWRSSNVVCQRLGV